MSLDNPLATGTFPYDDLPEADYTCPRCAEPLEPDTPMFYWGEGREGAWVCGDCFKDAVFSLNAHERAEMCGESVVYTEQMVDSARNNPGELADILYVDISTAEDVL
jgi:hypothetical protein